jgi:hypothetical protein
MSMSIALRFTPRSVVASLIAAMAFVGGTATAASSECGATLFWEGDGRDTMSIAAGTLDEPTGLATVLQIHVASAGDYYPVDASTPIRPE